MRTVVPFAKATKVHECQRIVNLIENEDAIERGLRAWIRHASSTFHNSGRWWLLVALPAVITTTALCSQRILGILRKVEAIF